MAGSVINRGNGKWELRIYTGLDANGKKGRKSKRISAPSKRAALKALDEFYWEISNEDRLDNDGSITFKEFAAMWEQRHNRKLSLTTRQAQAHLLNDRLMDYFSGVPLRNITEDKIMRFVGELHKPHQNSRDTKGMGYLSDTMIHKNYKLLNHILSKAVEWKYLEHNPCDDIPKGERPKPDYHHFPIWEEETLQEFMQIINARKDTASEVKNKAMFYLALTTGARKGEFCALTWEDIDWKQKSININKAQKYIDAHNVEIGEPKTKSSVRKLYVDDYVLSLLKRHKENQEIYLRDKGYENPEGYIFLAVRLRDDKLVPVSASCLYMWLSKICKENGLPHITVHSLRAMAASYSLAHGADVMSVKTMMGHESLRTTSIYLHPLDKQRKATAEILSNHLSKLRDDGQAET